MAKRRGRKPKSIPMKIGNDPSLWRYASLQEALEDNTNHIARLIQAGKEQAQKDAPTDKTGKPVPKTESA